MEECGSRISAGVLTEDKFVTAISKAVSARERATLVSTLVDSVVSDTAAAAMGSMGLMGF